MPFRIRVSLAIILSFLILALIGPLVLPITPLRDTVTERSLAGADSLFVSAGGLDVHYVDSDTSAADGPQLEVPLVLLHGYLFNTMTWRDVQPSLAQTGRVISFDRPGFGLTSRPEAGSWTGTSPYSPEAQATLTIALMDALGIEKAVLVGHNSGAPVALETALLAPERVSGLVLIAPAVYRVGGSPEWLRPLLGTPHLSRLGPLLMRQLAGEIGGNFVAANWSDPLRMDERALEAHALNFRPHNWDRGLWQVSRASHEVPFLDQLGAIGVPALVVHGAGDSVVEAEQSRQLAAELPQGTFALLDDCGHAVHEECPAAFTELVLSWLLDENLLAVQ